MVAAQETNRLGSIGKCSRNSMLRGHSSPKTPTGATGGQRQDYHLVGHRPSAQVDNRRVWARYVAAHASLKQHFRSLSYARKVICTQSWTNSFWWGRPRTRSSVSSISAKANQETARARAEGREAVGRSRQGNLGGNSAIRSVQHQRTER